MNDLNLRFQITDVTPWKRGEAAPVTCDTLATEIHQLQDKINNASNDLALAEFVTDFKAYIRIFYLREVLIGEGICDGKTSYEDVEELLSRPAEVSKLAQKTHNLSNALDMFLRVHEPTSETFTPELLSRMHQTIGVGIIANAGKLRKKYLAPAGEDWIYLAPHLVEKALENLCYNVKKAMDKTDKKDILGRVRIVSSFMTNFLHIHPYSNGNGRVARLAVSWLLSETTIVPIPIITSEKGRVIYLDAIRDSRHNTPFLPSNLARLILESIHSTVRKAIFCLDL